MSALRLLADLGGTNTRLALAERSGALHHRRAYRAADYDGFDAILDDFLRETGVANREIAAVMIAAAGPVTDGRVQLTNLPWTLSETALSQRLEGVRARIFNDLEAVAYALPVLEDRDFVALGPIPRPAPGRARRLAVNVGTGFGAATVLPAPGGWLACPSEAGHMTLGAQDPDELALILRLQQEAGPDAPAPSLEDALSGPGVPRLYEAVAEGSGKRPEDAAAVFALAAEEGGAGADEAARLAMRWLTRWLGRTAGDLALASAAWGGVFLIGGVVAGWQAHADVALFRRHFEAKGKMRARMVDVFTGVISREDTALLGLSQAPVEG